MEQNEGETVAILPGKFKPPHRGHLDMFEHYARLADRVVILVSPKEKDGITAQTAAEIINIYLMTLILQMLMLKLLILLHL